MNGQVDSSVSPCSDDIIVTGQNSVGSSVAELSQRSCSLTGVKSIHESEHRLRKCSNQSSIQSFFKPVSKAQQHETAAAVCNAQQIDEAAVHSTKNSRVTTVYDTVSC